MTKYSKSNLTCVMALIGAIVISPFVCPTSSLCAESNHSIAKKQQSTSSSSACCRCCKACPEKIPADKPSNTNDNSPAESKKLPHEPKESCHCDLICAGALLKLNANKQFKSLDLNNVDIVADSLPATTRANSTTAHTLSGKSPPSDQLSGWEIRIAISSFLI